MVQIIEEQGIGGNLGSALGGGISSGLQMLMQAKVEGLKQQEKLQSVQNLLKGYRKKGMLPSADGPASDEGQVDASIQEDIYEGTDDPSTEELAILKAVIGPAADPFIQEAQEKRKIAAKEKAQHSERNLKVFDEASDKLRTLEESDKGLQQLSQLSEKIADTSSDAQFARFLRSWRFDPETGGFTRIGKATSTPEEERFVKLIADQTKNIKDDYGARITNLDMQVFLRRFPDLMMTSQGRKEILGTLRDYNKAKRLYNQALKVEIKNAQGRVNPYTLDDRVEAKIQPQLEKMRKDMAKRGLANEQPEEVEEEVIRVRNPKTGQTLILKEGKWQVE